LRRKATVVTPQSKTLLFEKGMGFKIERNQSEKSAAHAFLATPGETVMQLYFLDARSKLIEIAAFLDRAERSAVTKDYRLRAFQQGMAELTKEGANGSRASRVLLAFSDMSKEPVDKIEIKSAAGACPIVAT
jgi:hypothetical protein